MGANVGPALHEDLEVETGEHDPVPPPDDNDKTHDVMAMEEVNLGPLGVDIGWSESHDHAKLAISAHATDTFYVCVGDLNFTLAQRKRGGGAVAFQSEGLWNSLPKILTQTVPASQAKRQG